MRMMSQVKRCQGRQLLSTLDRPCVRRCIYCLRHEQPSSRHRFDLPRRCIVRAALRKTFKCSVALQVFVTYTDSGVVVADFRPASILSHLVPMPVFDYTNKVVLVTGLGAVGEGYGNGTAMASAMARQGATIFGCDINLEAANRAADMIRDEAEVRNHPSRKQGRSIVDVIQQSTVSALTTSEGSSMLTSVGRHQEAGMPSLRRCLYGEAWSHRHFDQ